MILTPEKRMTRSGSSDDPGFSVFGGCPPCCVVYVHCRLGGGVGGGVPLDLSVLQCWHVAWRLVGLNHAPPFEVGVMWSIALGVWCRSAGWGAWHVGYWSWHW